MLIEGSYYEEKGKLRQKKKCMSVCLGLKAGNAAKAKLNFFLLFFAKYFLNAKRCNFCQKNIFLFSKFFSIRMHLFVCL